jgi:exonuclease VII large subunit
LGGRRVALPSAAAAAVAPVAPRKRNLSPAARKRIAMAQKRRWAEHRRQKAQAAKGDSKPE